MSKKICFVIPGFNDGGGTERVTSLIANQMAKREYEVAVLSLSTGTNPVFEVEKGVKLLELGGEWISLKDMKNLSKVKKIFALIKRVFAELKISRKLKKQLRALKPDVVICSDIAHYSKVEKARKSLKFKAIAWEVFNLNSRQSYFINRSRKLAVKYASKIIVQGDADLADYQNKYEKATNIMQIYNGVSMQIENVIDVNNKVVITAGRLSKEKGYDMLIDIWQKVSDKAPEWQLNIFGDGDERENLQSKIDDYGLKSVKIFDFSKDIENEMKKSSIFVLSSRFEGFGMVLVEAQAKGLPIVSFDIKNGPSLIVDDGVNGFLIEPFNLDEFAQKLSLLMSDENLRQNFSNASQKDLGRFDINNIGSKWAQLIDEN